MEHPIVSGEDEYSTFVRKILRRRGLAVRRDPVSATHVEMKLAARMIRDGITHTDVVINNRPCGRELGCDTLLPILLPDGYSITVHGPNYRKTFTGGAASPWH